MHCAPYLRDASRMTCGFATAAELKLTGYTRNLDDGRVEVYAAGPPAKLDELRQRLSKGPRFADVRGVDEQEAAVQPYSSFRIEG